MIWLKPSIGVLGVLNSFGGNGLSRFEGVNGGHVAAKLSGSSDLSCSSSLSDDREWTCFAAGLESCVGGEDGIRMAVLAWLEIVGAIEDDFWDCEMCLVTIGPDFGEDAANVQGLLLELALTVVTLDLRFGLAVSELLREAWELITVLELLDVSAKVFGKLDKGTKVSSLISTSRLEEGIG